MNRKKQVKSSPSIFALLKFGAFAGALAGAGAFAYSYWVEPFDVRLERITIRLPKAAGRLPKQGLRILHLSDTHFFGAQRQQREEAKIEAVRRVTQGLEYELLVHTGDFIHQNAGVANTLALLDAVPRPRIGSYGVLGNHDYAHFAMGQAPKRMWRSFNQRTLLKQFTPVKIVHHLWHFLLYVRNTPLDGPPIGSNDANRLCNALDAWGMTLLHNRGVHLRSQPSTPSFIAAGQGLVNGHTHNGYNGNGQITTSNEVEKNTVSVAISAQTLGGISLDATQAKREGGDNRASSPVHNGNGVSTGWRLPINGVGGNGVDFYLAGVDDWCEGNPNLTQALRDAPPDAPVILLSHNPDSVLDPALEGVDLMLSGHTHGGQLVLPLWGPAHTQCEALGRHEVAGYTRRGRTQVYTSRGLGEGIPVRFGAHPHVTLITVTG